MFTLRHHAPGGGPGAIPAVLLTACALGLAGCGGESAAPAPPPEAAGLVETLRRGEPAQREEAAAKLGAIKHDGVRHALLAAAHEDNRLQVRVAAVRAMARQDPPDQQQAVRFLGLLSDSQDEVRAAACDAIGAWRWAGGQDALMERLKDRSGGVRIAALAALTRMGATDRLVGIFQSGTGEERAAVARALAEGGDKSKAPLLMPALEDQDEYLRRVAAEALGRLGDERAIEPLMALVRKPLPQAKIAEFASRASAGPTPRDLGRIAEAMNAEQVARGFRGNVLPGQLKTSDPNVRSKYQALVHEDQLKLEAMVRGVGLEAIGKIGGKPATEAVLRLLGDADSAVAEAAKTAARGMGELVADGLIALLADAKAPAGARLRAASLLQGQDNDKARAALVAALKDPDESVRAFAATTLAAGKSPAAGEALLGLLQAGDAGTRRVATESLAGYPDTATTDALIKALASERDAGARKAILKTLGVLRDKRATSALLQLARDARDPQRVEAVHALTAIADPAAAAPLLAIYRALSDQQDSWFRGQVIVALGASKARDAVPLLIAELKGRRAPQAMAALGDIGDPAAVPAIAEALRRPIQLNKVGVDEHGAAGIPALVKLHDARAVEILVWLVRAEDPAGATNRAAAEALAKLALPEATAALIGLLGDAKLPAAIRESAVAPALMTMGEAAVGPLAKVLSAAPAPEAKSLHDPGQYAAQVLGHIGKPALPVLECIARQKPARHVVGRLIESLHPIDDDAAAALLGQYLKDPDATVRQWAAVALGKSKAPSSVALLKSAREDADAGVRTWVVWALKEHGLTP